MEEVASRLGGSPEGWVRLLERMPEAIPGARCGPDGWEIHERDLRRLVCATGNAGLPQLATVVDVAQALRKDRKTIVRWLTVRGPAGERLLRGRKLLGEWRIEAASVLELPEVLPAWARAEARPVSFFSTTEGGQADG